MDRSIQVRGAFILCAHFARNVTYYRAGRDFASTLPEGAFWSTVNNNFIDIAILEWCKLFADPKAEHHWRKVVRDPEAFKACLLNAMEASEDEFSQYIIAMRTYRDKFVAHLDAERTANIPSLTIAERCAEHLHSYLVEHQLDELHFASRPISYQAEVQLLQHEAAARYRSVGPPN